MKLGADLSQPREVNHYLVFLDKEVASRVAGDYGKNWKTAAALGGRYADGKRPPNPSP